MIRALGASVVVASALLAAGQGCALFTCIEDDCASLSSGTGGRGVGGAGAMTAASGMTATAVNATGAGGSGGAAPCEGDCPICSDELDGTTGSLTVLGDDVYVLVDTPGPTALFTLSNEANGFGLAEPVPGESYPATGHLVATVNAVFHIDGPTFQNIGSGETCGFANPIVAAAATDATLYLLHPGALQSFTESGCSGSPLDIMLAGATSLAVSPDVIATDRTQSFSGPCFKLSPFSTAVEPTCAPKQEPLAVAMSSSGKRILFRTATGVAAWEPDLAQPVVLVASFDGQMEGALPIAAGETEVFFARSNAEHHLHRCLFDPPYTCRSTGNDPVRSIHVRDGMAYFTMGRRVCKW